MDAITAEIRRQVANLIRIGTISEVDHGSKRVRVKTGNLETNWLQWTTPRAGTTKEWNPPTIGEQVIIFSPDGDLATGKVMSALYSDDYDSPSISHNLHRRVYPDGAVIEYDHAAHALNATLPEGGTALLTAPTSVTVRTESVLLDAPETRCTGNMTVDKRLTYLGGMTGRGGEGAAALIEGKIHATGDIKAGDISVQDHHHDESIGDQTSKAKP